MFDHLDAHHTALPPPRTARSGYDALRPGLHRVAPVAAFLGTLIVVALAIVSALTLLASSPTGLAIPITLSLVGGLAAVGLAIRSRVTHARRAHVSMPRRRAVDGDADTRVRRVRSAREDRAMLLRGGWGAR